MPKFTHVLLDLDGTLTNPQEGITKSVACALDHFSIPYTSFSSLTSFIGPPLDVSFADYGLKQEQIPVAIEKFRDYYKNQGIFECKLFEDVPKLLESLKTHDKKIFLATSKALPFAKRILEYFNITQYFDFISGSNLDGTRVIKGEVIAYALEETKTKPSSTVVMIGDRKHDIIGAKTHNLVSVGILYGFGSKEELQEQNPDYIIDSMADLTEFLIQA